MPALANASYIVPKEYLKFSGVVVPGVWGNMCAYMIATLVASSRWEVPQWSDGTTYHNDGSVPAEGDLPAGSWVVVKAIQADNAAGDKQEWCFIFVSDSATTGTVCKHSRSDGFTGGSAAVPPVAADQEYLAGSSDVAGGKFCYNSGNYTGIVGFADKDSNSFCFGGYYSAGNGEYEMGWFVDTLSGGEDGDDYPYVFMFDGADQNCYAKSTLASPVTIASRPARSYRYDSGIPGWVIQHENPWFYNGNVQSVPDSIGTNNFPGAPTRDLFPVLWGEQGSATYRTAKGWSRFLYWSGQAPAGPPYRTLGDWKTTDPNGTILLWQAVAIPWDGSSINLTNCGAWAEPGGGTTVWTQPSQLEYIMRGYDGSLGRQVYWSAPDIDASGASYTGPGPLTKVKVFTRIPPTALA